MYISNSNQERFQFLPADATCSKLLPLGILASLEGLENAHHLLQCRDLLLHGRRDRGLVTVAQLGVKFLAVWSGRHGGTENGLDNPGMIGLKGAAVGLTERGRQLSGGIVEVVA